MTATEISRVEDENQQAAGPGMLAVAQSRAAQEVQSAMLIAKRFPRDETASIARILQSCKRKGLAEAAVYSYPRGNTTVEGPSIRLAEAMAQSWGNLDFGIIELEQKNGESQVMAYAWDLETNTRQTKIFSVPHKRHTKSGAYALTDPRDIYEMVANQGARRLRACILGVIPGDVQDSAIAECEKTLRAGSKEPLIDRIRAMISAFSEIGVNQAMIEGRLRHKSDAISEAEIVALRKIYRSLADNMAKREEFFEVGSPTEGKSKTERVAEALDKNADPPQGSAPDSGASPAPGADAAPAPSGKADVPGPQGVDSAAGKPDATVPASGASAQSSPPAVNESAADFAANSTREEINSYLYLASKSKKLSAAFTTACEAYDIQTVTNADDDAVRKAACDVRAAELALPKTPPQSEGWRGLAPNRVALWDTPQESAESVSLEGDPIW